VAPVLKIDRTYADFESEKKTAPSPVANAWGARPAPARCCHWCYQQKVSLHHHSGGESSNKSAHVHCLGR